MQLRPGAVAGIDQPKRRELVKIRAVGLRPARLGRLLCIPVQPEPVQIALERLGVFRPAAVRIQILDAQQHPPAPAAHRQPREQRGKNVSQVHPAAGTRRKASCQHGDLLSVMTNGRVSPAVRAQI